MSHIVSFFCRATRVCMETTTIGDITFPKGVLITIPIYELHHDYQYWVEPEKFNPDRYMYLKEKNVMFTLGVYRFTPEERAKRPQLAHVPFGFGPRNCIGMRFALLEAKIALMELLKRYTFVRALDTEVNQN